MNSCSSCETARTRLSLMPWWLLSMAVLGPAIFLASWPWLWHDTVARLKEYAAFHLNHVYYNMAYFGVNYFAPPFPVSFPWVMTALTVPLTTLVLAAVGLLAHASALWPSFLCRVDSPCWRQRDPLESVVLLFGSLFAPLAVISLPFTPIFGGTKHWFPAYPFLVLFAGLAFAAAAQRITSQLPAQRSSRLLKVALALCLLAPAGVETAHSHPFGLSHYTAAVGGVPGAAKWGMNRQYWGFTTGSVVEYLKEQLPHGGRVWLCDTTVEAWRMLRRDGKIPAGLRSTPHIAKADFALVHHEHHFAEVDHQIWTTYGTVQPAHVLEYDGVPIISIYRNPHLHRARPIQVNLGE